MFCQQRASRLQSRVNRRYRPQNLQKTLAEISALDLEHLCIHVQILLGTVHVLWAVATRVEIPPHDALDHQTYASNTHISNTYLCT